MGDKIILRQCVFRQFLRQVLTSKSLDNRHISFLVVKLQWRALVTDEFFWETVLLGR